MLLQQFEALKGQSAIEAVGVGWLQIAYGHMPDICCKRLYLQMCWHT